MKNDLGRIGLYILILSLCLILSSLILNRDEQKNVRSESECIRGEKGDISAGKCQLTFNHKAAATKILYTCPMHQEVRSENKDDRCPICGMNLVPVKGEEFSGQQENSSKKEHHHKEAVKEGIHAQEDTLPKKQIYTCPMHQEVRSENKDDRCPICGMNLVPVKEEKELEIAPDKLDVYGIKISKVKKIDGVKTIVTVGNFEYDERNICEVTSKINGWVKKLYMNFEGAYIQKYHKLALIYSPELGRLHTELIFYKEADKKYKENYKNIVEHFQHLGLSRKEITRLTKLKKTTYYFWIDSPCEGVITKKYIFKDSYIREGDKLYEISDIKNIWFIGRIFESDIQLLRTFHKENILYRCPMHHNSISKVPGICPIETCHMPLVPFNTDITIVIIHPLLEGGEYSDYVDLIYPDVEEETRTTRFRVNVPNKKYLLKKGAFANATITIRLRSILAVPETAVVFSGEKNLVFVYKEGKIIPRTVIIGEKHIERTDESEKNPLAPYKIRYMEILSGVEEGEEIISSGTFLIDAESQLRKAVSEMEPVHNHK